MEALLRAIGLGCGLDGQVVGCAPAACAPAVCAKAAAVRGIGVGKGEDKVLTIEQAAFETEREVEELEAEARSLAEASLSEAIALLGRWAQSFRQRARDDSAPSFRAVFLRSDALQLAISALARNMPLQSALRDPPLFVSAVRPEEVLLADARTLIQRCTPRSASSLAAPLLMFAVDPDKRDESGAAKVVLEALKDSWGDVVRSQAARSLERRLDASEYDLQKSCAALPRRPGTSRCAEPFLPTESPEARKALHSRVAVLAQLCALTQESQRHAEARALRLATTLRALGVDADFAGLLPAAAGVAAGGAAGGAATGRSGSDGSSLSSRGGSPGSQRDDLLALKQDGLCFDGMRPVPLSELEAVCSHRSRRCVFHGCVVSGNRRGEMVAHPSHPSGNCSTLLERLHCSDRHLDGGLSRESTAPSLLSDCFAPPRLPPPPELVAALAEAAAAMPAELRRGRERLATQLQQRRGELVAGLETHLANEQARIRTLVTNASRANLLPSSNSAAVAHERLSCALSDARHLCRLATSVVCRDGRADDRPLDVAPGQLCRARWADGNFYDASVHRVLGDGNIMVNWLRPRPPGCDYGDFAAGAPPLITVSEAGGDDSLHRIVAEADVQFRSLAGQLDSDLAQELFERRPPEDLLCVDCGGEGADWASVSFGAYLCVSCAREHSTFGPRVSYVRALAGGYGWTAQDLQSMELGGNAAFRAFLEQHPAVKAVPLFDRYYTKLAEHYRRRLDALCTGAQPPPPLAPEAAAVPTVAGALTARAPHRAAAVGPGRGDFLGAAEAAELVRRAVAGFEAAMREAGAV